MTFLVPCLAVLQLAVLQRVATSRDASAAAPSAPALRDEPAQLETLVADARRAAPDSDSWRAAWARVLEVDSRHTEAHLALGHHLDDGVWHTTYATIAAARRLEDVRRLRERGEVRLGQTWVAWDEAPYLRMGWTRDVNGVWRAPVATTLFPAEADWSTHATEHLVLHTRLAPTTAASALAACARTPGDLQRLFGCGPVGRQPFVLLCSLQEYNELAGGPPGAAFQATELSGTSGLHLAYFADAWFETTGTRRTFRGTGVGYWEAGDPRAAAFGPFSARHAASLAWLQAFDPSPLSIADASLLGGGVIRETFWDEKLLPCWMHAGAAMYAERFFLDESASDPTWAITWAKENLRARGPIAQLAQILRFRYDAADVDAVAHTMGCAGLLVAFIADGGEPRVTAALDGLRSALRAAAAAPSPLERLAAREVARGAARALERALVDAEEAWLAFAR